MRGTTLVKQQRTSSEEQVVMGAEDYMEEVDQWEAFKWDIHSQPWIYSAG